MTTNSLRARNAVGTGALLALIATSTWALETHSVSGNAAREWLRWTIPLPHEAHIERSATVTQTGVRLTVNENSPLAEQAARTIADLFMREAGVADPRGDEFEILLGLVDAQGRIAGTAVPDAERLSELPNSEQAYIIRPGGENRLILAALDPRGLYYAALTLTQLLESRFLHGTVTIPLASITDWPDLAERGLWGGTSVRDIEWMAQRKMNIVEFHSPHSVKEDGTIEAAVSEVLLRRGEIHAVKMVPIISHINHLGRRGVYNPYPELRGKGEKAIAKSSGGSDMYAPCASNPKLAEILAGWMKEFAADERVRDISCWLGELRQHCECEQCSKGGQFALEARAFVNAWKLAVKDIPDLRIRILLTQGSYDTNDKVLAEVPPEVGVTYYDGGRTYDSSKEPMIYPLLEEYAADGGWLGCYPQLTPSWRIESPWSSPQFVKFRMQEFVDKKLTSLVGYVVIDNKMNDFNVTAAAEWSWNAHGRDEAEFARAWATRQGIKAVDVAADWALKGGAAGWDIYGARLVERTFFRPASLKSILRSRAAPTYGQGMLRYIADRNHLDRNLADCREALRCARQVGTTAMLAEIEGIESYYRMLINIVNIQEILANHPLVTLDVRARLQKHMNALALAGADNAVALRQWERCVSVGAGGGRLLDSLKATGGAVAAVAETLEQHGVRKPPLFLTPRVVDTWNVEDFRENARREMIVDLTDSIRDSGTYLVTFQYTTGWNGLHTWRTALAESDPDTPKDKTEIDVDEHEGSTGARSHGNIYRLTLQNYNPMKKYWLLADVRGTRPQDQKPGHTGCSGEIQLQQERPPDWTVRLLQTKPLSAEEKPVAGVGAFTGKGIRVGVLQGGYGSDGMLKCLGKTTGIDALPVAVGALRTDECQVIIYPQLRWDAVPADLPPQLEAYVRNGGGLIAVHDAVGYRSHPPILVEVCKGGSDHVRHQGWRLAPRPGPLGKGMPTDADLTRGYYDQVELNPGPAAQIVAVSAQTGNPVVLAGSVAKGRYVACGLLLGTDAEGDDAQPTEDEATLLLNAIRWCARIDSQ